MRTKKTPYPARTTRGTRFAEGVGEPGARGEVIGLKRNLAGGWELRVGDESGAGKGLEIPAEAETETKVVGDADGVLRESGVLISVGMRSGAAEVLQIVVRDFVGVRAQGAQRESGFHGLEGEGIDLDGIEKIFAALLAGEKIVDPSEEAVAAELPCIAAAFVADRFGEVQAMLAGLAGKKVGASYAVEDVKNFNQHVVSVVGLLKVAGELGAEMADPA